MLRNNLALANGLRSCILKYGYQPTADEMEEMGLTQVEVDAMKNNPEEFVEPEPEH
jgi:hypothetical protein